MVYIDTKMINKMGKIVDDYAITWHTAFNLNEKEYSMYL